jgi:hypothetical protein
MVAFAQAARLRCSLHTGRIAKGLSIACPLKNLLSFDLLTPLQKGTHKL